MASSITDATNVSAKESGELVSKCMAMPRDTNANGDMFGGWLVSQMDLGAGILASRQSHGRVVTVAIDKMTFLLPVYVGDTVCCYAKLLSTGTTSMLIKVEVWVTRRFTLNNEKVTEGLFTFVAVDDDGKPRKVGD